MLVSKPVSCDQSNREPLKEASSWSSELSTSSNIHLLCSLHVHHINHNRTKFQMSDECFPNQFHQPKEDQVPFLVKPTDSQRIEKTKHHNLWALSQWSNKWSTISSQQLHITHQSTKAKPLIFKLSPVTILSQAAAQTKKGTQWGALTFQIPFQEKTMERGPCNSI